MNKLTKEHKELLMLIANEWSFKAFVLDYEESRLYKRFLHRMEVGDPYYDNEAEVMNGIRDKWIAYHKGEYDNLMPEQWAKFKQHKY